MSETEVVCIARLSHQMEGVRTNESSGARPGTAWQLLRRCRYDGMVHGRSTSDCTGVPFDAGGDVGR